MTSYGDAIYVPPWRYNITLSFRLACFGGVFAPSSSPGVAAALRVAFQSACNLFHNFLPTTHSPYSSREPSSRLSNSWRIPRKLRLRTRNVTGVTRASEGVGISPLKLMSSLTVAYGNN